MSSSASRCNALIRMVGGVIRALTSLLAVLLLVGLLPAAPAAARSGAGDYAASAHRSTNAKRDNNGLDPLTRNACLKTMARKQARRMARKGQMFHQRLGRVQDRCDVGWAGENVAYGFGTGKAVVKAWIKSPGHRENILRPQFESMGIAAVRRNGVWWVAQVFGTEA